MLVIYRGAVETCELNWQYYARARTSSASPPAFVRALKTFSTFLSDLLLLTNGFGLGACTFAFCVVAYTVACHLAFLVFAFSVRQSKFLALEKGLQNRLFV